MRAEGETYLATLRDASARASDTFAVEVLECDSDSDAMAKAKELLAQTTTFHLMEVWQGARKVGVVERG